MASCGRVCDLVVFWQVQHLVAKKCGALQSSGVFCFDYKGKQQPIAYAYASTCISASYTDICMICGPVSPSLSLPLSLSLSRSLPLSMYICHVMSCHAMSCHVMASHVMSCHGRSCQYRCQTQGPRSSASRAAGRPRGHS